jgi:hypothetical protein
MRLTFGAHCIDDDMIPSIVIQPLSIKPQSTGQAFRHNLFSFKQVSIALLSPPFLL